MQQDSEIGELIADIRERVLYMQELGVDSLSVSLSESLPITASQPEQRPPSTDPISNLRSEIPNIPAVEARTTTERPAGSRLAELPSLKARKPSKFFDKYNPLDAGEDRKPSPVSLMSVTMIEIVPERADVIETVEQIHAEIGPDCARCKLSQLGRTQVVNSVGNRNAELMFCGEAPGADEDKYGEPFVGRAGQLLTDIIEKGLQMSRSDVFIGNINRCRPPGNRAPEPDESSVCKPFLFREIAVVRPKVIVVLGATAAQNLLETKVPISKLRGRFHDHLGTKVMPTFHPAYLLRDPNKKREVWDDMKMVRDYLREVSAK
ncbi:MAG TPA: uracil-DNA glycosylase [Pyrinomonadaceae bacterium]|jgi:DNA polymerase|nr:uracil-DNA glycosylase [Pyrinomonadaceae bacterium]